MGWRDAPLVTPTKPPPNPQAAPKSWRDAPAVKDERSWLGTAAEAVQNIPSSAVKFGKDIVGMVTHPVETAGSLFDLAAGALETGIKKTLPKDVYAFYRSLDPDPASAQRAVNTANQVGGVYRQRYGTMEALKRTIATDPVGAAADLSTIFSGGAGAVRGVAKASARVAPRVSVAAGKTANQLTRAAAATNPVNALTKPTKVVVKALEKAPLAAQRIISPKGAAYMAAAEGQAPAIVAQLRAPNLEIVPGSKPTAAQAASPLNVTKFSALGASAEKALPTPYYERGLANEAARTSAVQSVGKTPADITSAIAAREAATGPLYQAAEARKFRADPQLMQLADDPYIKQALPDAIRLSKSQGVSFAANPTRFIHNIKISLDKMLTRSGDTALARGERAQVMDVKNRLVGWLETKAPEYQAARTTFAGMSKPINQMEVGQYLEGKLATPLDVGQRANVFAGAVKDAPGTIKRATTNEARFKALTDVLDPAQVQVIEAIRADLARAAKTQQQAKVGGAAAPKATDLASAAERGLRLPNLLNRVTALANDIMSRLRGKIDSKLAIQLATEMLDPQAAANALEKAMRAETRAVNIGQKGAAAAKVTGRGLRSPAALAGERTRNAMRDIPVIEEDLSNQ